MNRQSYFNFIEEKLSFLAFRLERRGGLNILDLHLHSENFYLHLLNLLFGWSLQNQNAVQANAASIDLIDTTHMIIAQVSATATKQKIESALSKDLSKYNDYTFKFISISKNAANLQKKTFINPHQLNFSPVRDIIDIQSILRFISDMGIDQQKRFYDFLKKELKTIPDPDKIESNLTTIIKILAREDWSQGTMDYETVPYNPEEKITYNDLDTARTLIDDFKIHYPRIDKIYSDFDKQGVNKSYSILNGIRQEYLALMPTTNPDKCFFTIIEKITKKVRESSNYSPIPDEELVLCVQILVVDAFIRCKIFKNPAGETHADS